MRMSQDSFQRVGNVPADADPRGMTLAGNQVFILLDAARALALDRGFAYVASENVAVNSAGSGLGGLERERATGL